MNAYMNINVRVLSAQAQAQIRALQAQVRALQGQLAAANATSAAPDGIGSARSRKSLSAWGNQIQWTGRQLQYNWTLPLAVAAGAAVKWQLDSEKAFTRVEKVYGDTTAAAAQFRKEQKGLTQEMAEQKATAIFEKELEALDRAMVALSSRYGVARAEVNETAGAWAAAGVSGVALAKSTELSIKAAVLGDMELAKATESLIAIQSQYSLNTQELNLTLAELNSIENQTGISMQGLIDGFARSAGVAREAGVDVRHLGAMLAALVPATGTAATAGNALKTIISRLMSPTGDAAAVMKEFGVDTSTAMWQSSTAMERLLVLAEHMGDGLKETADGGYELSDSQKQVVASVLGSRYQMNRFLVLMRELGPEQSYYEAALKATADRQKVFQTATEELNAVLESNPRRLQIIWTTLQNGMATAITPMIPYILYLAESVARMVEAFNQLDPSMQKFILLSLLAVAAVGPLVKYFGSLITLIGTVILPFKLLATGWGNLMTVTKKVDGVNKTTRLTILGLIGSMLKLPFVFVGRGFMFIAGMALKSIAQLRLLVPVFAWVIGFMIGTVKSLPAIFAATWGVLKLIWAAGIAALAMISRGLLATVGFMRATMWMLATGATSVWRIMGVIWAGGIAGLAAIGRGTAFAVGIVVGTMRMLPVLASAIWAVTAAVWAAGINLLGVVTIARFKALALFLVKWGKWFVGWPAALVLAALAVFAMFGDEIKQIWSNLVEYFSDSSNAMTQLVLQAFNALPQGVANALIAVANIVRDAALQIYEWFSYINPFARHSPSLVENVTVGMKVVGDQFGKARSVIGGHVKGAYRDIKAFGNAIRGLMNGAASLEQAEQRKDVKKFAPGALDEFDQLANRLRQLQGDLARIEPKMNKQQAVVDKWTDAVDRANAALDRQQDKLDKLTAVQDKWQDRLQAAEERLDSFASAPIRGMGEMSDRIFENEMAQKRLRLEMMKMEETLGPLDDIKSKIDAINGAQELLRGEQASLRGAGAGSEILSFYDNQIAALEATKDQQQAGIEQMDSMSKALDELQRKGERLDLVNSLRFDPLTRQIEQAANAMEELPFDTIMAGVKAASADIEVYEGKLAAATAEVDKQQRVVDQLTRRRDALQNRLDRETAILDKIKERYDEVAEAIRAVESAMNDAASAAGKMQQAKDAKKGAGAEGYVSPAVQNFRDAAGGNFANVGGAGIPTRKNWADQSGMIDKFTEDIANQASDAFAGLNPFTWIKDKWSAFKQWWGGAWSGASAAARDMVSAAFRGLGGSGGITNVADRFRIAWAKTKDWFTNSVIKPLKQAWQLLSKPVNEFIDNARDGLMKMWGKISPELKKFRDEFDDLKPMFQGFLKVAKLVIGFLIVRFAGGLSILFNILASVVEPFLDMIGGVLGNVIQIFRGVFQIIGGFFMLFTSEWKEGLKKIGAGILNILSGTFGAIGRLIEGAFKIVLGIIWGAIKGIWRFFVWLWDVLVGHSVVPDLINGIIDTFKLLLNLARWVWDRVLKPIVNFFARGKDRVVEVAGRFWEGIKDAWKGLKAAGKWIWENVLKPVWDRVKALWSDWVKPGLSLWWSGIKNIWGALKAAAKWMWDNVLKPVWSKVQDVWVNIKGSLSKWWDGIKSIWNSLKGLGKWFKENVMDKVFDTITSVWQNIKDWLIRNKDMLLSPMKSIVNVIISAVNKIIGGLNKVADILPGVDWNIDTIDKFAAGGEMRRRANRGFKTNGARAIVGEGKANHPEFVIPTDPTYRNRAKSLLAMAASKIGLGSGASRKGAMGDSVADFRKVARDNPRAAAGAIPQFGIGGWLSDRWDDAKGIGKQIKDLPKKAVGATMNPLLNYAEDKINGIGWDPAEAPPMYVIGKLRSWTDSTQSQFGDMVSDAVKDAAGGAKVQRALRFARSQSGDPYVWGGVGPNGFDCSGFMSALTNVLRGQDPFSRVGATSSFPWAGFRSGYGPGNGFTIGSSKSYAGGVGHMAGTLGGINVESRGGEGVVIGSRARGANDAGFDTRAYLPLKEGGIALRRKGPILAAMGDGRYDEAVVPLPRGWRNGDLIGSSGGDRTINIYGDLSFPNIKDGDDAKTFLDNLEILATEG